MAKRTAHALQSAFKKWDEDGNGTISRQELGSILSKLGNFKPTDIETVLKEADTNKDGVIDYEEFIQWLAAPAAPLGAAALMSESSACLRAEAAAPDIPPTTVASADCPASWDFGDCGYSKPVPFTEAVELAVQHTIAVWMRLEALKGNPFMTIVSDPMWGLQIGLSDEGGFTVNDPRRKGFVSPEVPAPEGILNKWVLFIVCGSCSTPSPSMEGETEFFVGVDVHGVRSLGSVPVCGSGLVLRDFGCKGQGLASIASVAVWQRRLKDEEIKEIFLWDAVKLGTLSAKEASWLKLNRRIAPDRNEEEEDLFAERLALAAEGKAPGGTLNVAGLKISDKDLPRILDHVERAYDSVSALVLSNNYITEDGVKSHLVPFLSVTPDEGRVYSWASFAFKLWLDGCYKCVALWANITALFKWTFVLLAIPTLFYIDAVEWLRRGISCGTAPVLSLDWLLLSLVCWTLVFVTQAHFWYWLLSVHPIIITEFLVILLVTTKSLVLRLLLSQKVRDSLPSRRLARLGHHVLKPPTPERPKVRAAAITTAAHVLTRWEQMINLHPMVPYVVLAVGVAEPVLVNLFRRKPMPPWTISPVLVHAALETAYVEDCDTHDACGLCLDSLCTSVNIVAACPLEACVRARSSLAVCRSSLAPTARQSWPSPSGDDGSVPRRRTRGASPGLSAARSRSFGGSTVGVSSAGRVAELKCGHKFHAGCAEKALNNWKGECPNCRARLETGKPANGWKDIVAENEVWQAGVGLVVTLILLGAQAFHFRISPLLHVSIACAVCLYLVYAAPFVLGYRQGIVIS